MSSLTSVRQDMTQFGMSGLLVFGIIGNLFNIVMFTRKEPLHNSCSLYILAACILNLFNLCWGIIPSLIILRYPDFGTYWYWYCKIYHYLTHSPLMMSRTFTVLACIDRFTLCSNSVLVRSFNEPKIALRTIIATIVFWLAVTIFLPISAVYQPGSCSLMPLINTIWVFYSVIVPGILIPGLMIIFGGLAILYRNELRRRLNTNQGNIKKREYTLVIMLFSEVIVYVLSTCLFPAVTLYVLLTSGMVKSPETLQIQSFIQYLATRFLIYIYPSAGFYIYIAVSKSYRTECKRTVIRAYMRLTGKHAIVLPATTHWNNTVRNPVSH